MKPFFGICDIGTSETIFTIELAEHESSRKCFRYCLGVIWNTKKANVTRSEGPSCGSGNFLQNF